MTIVRDRIDAIDKTITTIQRGVAAPNSTARTTGRLVTVSTAPTGPARRLFSSQPKNQLYRSIIGTTGERHYSVVQALHGPFDAVVLVLTLMLACTQEASR